MNFGPNFVAQYLVLSDGIVAMPSDNAATRAGKYLKWAGDGLTLTNATGAGGAAWGSITGTLADQTDLQTALDALQPLDADLTAIAALTGTDTIYYRSGAGTWSAITIGSGLSFSTGTLSASGGGGTAWGDITGTLSSQTDLQAALDALQPLDADLTAIAALTGTDTIYYRSGAGAWSAITIGGGLSFSTGTLSASGAAPAWGDITGTLSSQTDLQAALDALQPLDADLTAIAALTGTDTIYYRSGAGTWTAVTIGTGLSFSSGTLSASGGGGTAWGDITGTLSSQTDLQAALDAKQDADADLTSIAAITTTGVLIYRSGISTWSTVTIGAGIVFSGGTLSCDLAWGEITGTLSSQTDLQAALDALQPLDADLTAIAALTGTNTIYYRSGAGTWTAVTIGTGLSFSSGTLSASGAAPAWGDITGTLSSQTDLQSAFDAKQDADADLTSIAAITGTGVLIYRSGISTWSTVTVGTGLSFSGGTLSAAVGTTVQAYDADTAKLDVSQTWTAAQISAVTSQTFASTFSINTNGATLKHKVTLTADITSFTLTNGTEGQSLIVYILQDSTGGWTVTFSGIDGTEPTIDTAADALTVVELEYVATTGWRFV